MNDIATHDHAAQLDAVDELRSFRSRFSIPARASEPGIYLCANSLGLQPWRAAELVNEVLQAWRALGVHGHEEGERPWLPYHELLADLTAQLVGARSREVVNMNTLTVNLHLMMVSFYRPAGERNRIVIERGAFPSDRYAVESQIRLHGLDPADALVELSPRSGEDCLREEDIEAYLKREGDRVALFLFPGVQYYTGQRFDMGRLTRAAHAAGAYAGFDLAHAAGNVGLELHADGMDFAAWCNYKYMNGGPGAVAGAFVHERHLDDPKVPRLHGWWGHDKATRFRMGPDFRAIGSVEAWQLSNPPILSLAPVLASLEIFAEAGMPRLIGKSLRLTGYLERLIDARVAGRIAIVTPRDPAARGCQLSLRVLRGGGRAIFERITRSGVVCDWREPDVIRVAPAPLYNTFEDVRRFVLALEEALS